MPPIRAICFDLFNTLVSVAEVPDSVGRFTADVLGLDTEVWNDACFGPAHEICRPTVHEEVLRVLAHSIDPEISLDSISQAVRERQARFDYALYHVRQSTLDVLRDLRQAGLSLALVSNASTGEVAAWSRSPLAPLFDVTLFSCECGYKKPEPEIYLSAIHGLAVSSAGECLYVGDGGSHEFHGADAVGMQTMLTREFLSPHRYRRVVSEQAGSIHREIETLRDLRDFALSVSAREAGTGLAGPRADLS